MKILAIDQATVSGYAVVDNGVITQSGVWNLSDKKRSGESRGMRYIRLEKYLKDAHKTWNFDLVVHEQTLLRGGNATELANGFKAIILKFATENGIEVSCVHATELKKFATGNGKADKLEMIAACERLTGISPVDDNESDACLIGLWAWKKYGM